MFLLTRRSSWASLDLVSVLALAGCATGMLSEPTPVVTETPAASVDPIGYLCNRMSVSPEVLDKRPELDSLDAQSRAAVDSATWDDGTPLVLEAPQDWFVAEAEAEAITLMRILAEPRPLDGIDVPPRDAAVVTVTRIDNAPNLTAGWYVGASGECAITLDLGELTVPAISLDPAAPPQPSDLDLHLLVTEQLCNSGQDATGRVEIVAIRESADSVDIVIGIRPRLGDMNCPSNPPTPVTITLDSALGERSIMNATLATPRPIEAFEPISLD